MEKLLTLGTEVHFAKDEIIFHEDDEAKLLYVILSGRVALDAVVAGRNVRIQVLYAGDDLGWSAVLSQKRQFQARALEPVGALAFEIATLRRACEANPYFGCAFFERMFTLVADRLQSTREQLAAALAESQR
jgi:CRP-like cAMP-binding protein